MTSATMRYARAIALATLGHLDSAAAEAEAFERDFDRVPTAGICSTIPAAISWRWRGR